MADIWIGVNPLSWMNSDIPALGEHITVEQTLSEIALIGYQGVELEDKMRKALLKRPNLLKERELCLIGGWHSTFLLENSFEDELDSLQRHLDFLQQHGADVAILAECSGSIQRDHKTGLSARPTLEEDQWKRLAEGLEAFAQLVAQRNMVSAYHQHMGTVVQSSQDVDQLMARTESLGLLFDVGHLVFAGADPLQVLHKHLSRITHVHLKNVRLPRMRELLDRDGSFPEAVLDGVFTVPGDNGLENDEGVHFYPFVLELVRAGYKGWMVMEAEQDPSEANPIAYAGLGQQAMNYWLAKAEMAMREAPKSSVGILDENASAEV